jgi:rubrerythrin
MTPIPQETLNLIKYASTMEIKGRSFYEHIAELTDNEHGKKVFRKLAHDETEHLKRFRDIFSSVLGSDEWTQYVSHEEETKDTVIDKLIARVKEHGKEKRASDLEALRIGMELERDSIDKYQKWANQSHDPKVKEIFTQIIQEEEFHYDLLQAEYDNITNSGFWFDMAEFRMDGKY